VSNQTDLVGVTKPNLDKVTFKPIANDCNARRRASHGCVDMMEPVPVQ